MLAAPALIAAGEPWTPLALRALAPIRAGVAALGGPGLLRSWEIGRGGDFDRVQAEAAFTYDNALAGFALLAAGDRDGAWCLAEGLRLAQTQDRSYRDGRLRNAYAAGRQFADAPASARPPGWWDGAWREDAYQVGSAVGPVAFAMLLWTAMAEAPFLEAARAAADWCAGFRVADGGFAGGVIGHEPSPAALRWRSTEQNIDLAIAFARVGRQAAAAHAADFVRAMWEPAEARFVAGLTPSGARNGHSALDANLFPLLAWPREARFAPALDWVLARHGAAGGLDFDQDRDGAWLEGTAQAALLLRRLGREAEARGYAATIARHMTGAGWVRAASVPALTTGLETGITPGVADFTYPDRAHLGATAWVALAALGASPFD
ncbi:hypothetical protein [Plastoroseomonas arctica]|uniref:Glycosyl hydrolase n=1 Tax=Plastoroseomonas arctica TaxID=1509237 RepID=A0AAF1KUN8_9PROT|nr:hypothetical protein [Plastoroseomonas arctica]MBR0656637.1 hypothetical protein [Plastoroseomonas arctica]